MSFFEVAEDTRRPFVIDTGLLTATALGTAFDVSKDAGVTTIAVAQGVVETRSAVAVHAARDRLAAGNWIAYDQGAHSVDRGTREVGQVAAWRSNLIVAERESVSALVARISRWCPGRVVIADPRLGAERVSGLFDLRNPHRALEAVVHPAGGHVRQIASFLTVISPI